MVKGMGTPYNPLFPYPEVPHPSAPIAAATVFKDRNFNFYAAKVVNLSAKPRHSAQEMKIKFAIKQKATAEEKSLAVAELSRKSFPM